MKKINKKILIIIAIIIVTVIIDIMCIFEFNNSDNRYIIVNDIEKSSNKTLENINNKTVITQKIIASHNNLESINIEFDNLKDSVKKVYGKVKLRLKDLNSGNIIAEEVVYYAHIRENDKYKFKFNNQEQSFGKEYEVILDFTDNENENQLFSIKYNSEDTSNFDVNGEKNIGKIVLSEYYISTYRNIFFYSIIVALSAIINLICIKILLTKNINEEKIFLYTIPLICTLFLLFMPTMKNHDELYHWFRICDITEGNLIARFPDEKINFTSANIRKNEIGILGDKDWLNLKYKDIIELYKNNNTNIEKDFTDISTSAVYAPIQYTPQVVGTMLAKLFTHNVMITAYVARVFNLIFSVICLYYTIKIAPIGKRIFLVISYIPIAIEGFTSMSPDAITISVCFLFMAYILNITYNKEKIVDKKSIIIMGIMAIVLSLCKIVYLPIVLATSLIPVQKFKNRTNKFFTVIGIVVISGIFNLIWLAIASKYLVEFRGGESKLQLLYVLKNPIDYLCILLNTINFKGYNYLDSLFGGQLGWGELVKLNFIVPFTLFIIFVITTIGDNSVKNKFTLWQRAVLLGIVVMVSGLIFTSLYLQWTIVGNLQILGVQGRYFLPILPLIGYLLSQIKYKSEYEEIKVTKFSIITIMLLYMYVFLSLVRIHL